MTSALWRARRDGRLDVSAVQHLVAAVEADLARGPRGCRVDLGDLPDTRHRGSNGRSTWSGDPRRDPRGDGDHPARRDRTRRRIRVLRSSPAGGRGHRGRGAGSFGADGLTRESNPSEPRRIAIGSQGRPMGRPDGLAGGAGQMGRRGRCGQFAAKRVALVQTRRARSTGSLISRRARDRISKDNATSGTAAQISSRGRAPSSGSRRPLTASS